MSDVALDVGQWSEVNRLLRKPAFCNLSVPTVTEAIVFIAGRAHGDYGELLEAVQGPGCIKICIPGHDGSYAQGKRTETGYPGFTTWKELLMSQYGINSDQIYSCIVRPGHEQITHSREEADGFILRAQDEGWLSAYVLAHPHQMPRLMCCLLKAQEDLGYRLLLTPMFPVATRWDAFVFGSLGEVQKPRWEHVVEEWLRLGKYIENRWSASLTELESYLSDPNPLAAE